MFEFFAWLALGGWVLSTVVIVAWLVRLAVAMAAAAWNAWLAVRQAARGRRQRQRDFWSR